MKLLSSNLPSVLGIFALLSVGCLLLPAQQVPVAPQPVPQATPPPQSQPGAQNPQGQPPSGDTSATAKRGNSVAGANAPVDSNSYKVGPGDVLNIRVWGEGEFSGPVAVQQNGNITLPLVGDLQAGGMTPIQIQDELAKSLTKYVVKPLVTVTVQEVGSKRYYMDGMVARPGEYALVVPTTVLEALSKAGGVGEFANAKHIYILRGTKRIPFNYKDVLRGKRMDENILLQPGDHVVVP